jgi:hypothetical protein
LGLLTLQLSNAACLSIELTFDNSDLHAPPRITDAELMFGTSLSMKKTIKKLPKNEHMQVAESSDED